MNNKEKTGPIIYHFHSGIFIPSLPGYIRDIFSTRPLSKPAIIAPPTGTKKFLSVLCTKTSTLPFLEKNKLFSCVMK